MRNVIVTGGTRGLGLAIARELADGGYRVIAVARQGNEFFTAAAEQSAAAARGELLLRTLDLCELAGIPAFLANLTTQFGPVHGLVNNAGIGTSGILATMPDGQIERLIQLNVTSPIVFTKYAVRSMMLGRNGRIVNISSIVAGTGYSGLSAYAASKAALAGFTRALARELGPIGITVNTVAPGFVDTDMTQELTGKDRDKIARRSALRRMAEASDVAGAVAFLFSEHARNITGTTMTVDAGNTV